MSEQDDMEAMLDLVAAYALGVLPAAEAQRAAEYIATQPQARAEYEALLPAVDAIGRTAEEPLDPGRSARMKQRLMARVNAPARPAPTSLAPNVSSSIPSRRSSARSSWFAGAGLAAAAAVVFALVSTVQNMSLRSDLANANAHAAALQAQIAQNERVRTRDHEMIADLTATDAQRFPVAGGMVVRRGTHVYLTLHNLTALPHGKVYQAWTLAKGAKTVAPSITFLPSSAGDAVVALPENADTLAAVAMSVEPEGGSKAPTSKPTFTRPLS